MLLLQLTLPWFLHDKLWKFHRYPSFLSSSTQICSFIQAFKFHQNCSFKSSPFPNSKIDAIFSPIGGIWVFPHDQNNCDSSHVLQSECKIITCATIRDMCCLHLFALAWSVKTGMPPTGALWLSRIIIKRGQYRSFGISRLNLYPLHRYSQTLK